MSVRVDPSFMKDLKAFGLKDANKCMHCGNCTAVCPLSTPENPFPRKLVKYAQMGLKDKILKSPEPWLCYYCGDCSDTCPRGADPGEKFEIAAIAVVAVFIGLMLWIFSTWGITEGTPDLEHARLNSVWPAWGIEIGDYIIGGVLSFFLLSNTYRFFRFVMGDLWNKIPLEIYITQAKELLIHGLTQKRFGECTDRMQWIVHLLLMTGYSTIFFMVVVFTAGGIHIIGLSWEGIMFQRDVIYPFFHPWRLLGYYATFALLYATTYAMIGRMFLILLQLTTLTGIFIHFTRLLDWPMTTYVLYVIHLMVLTPMLVLEVPFSKWAHLAFRPVSIYLVKVQEKYNELQKGAS